VAVTAHFCAGSCCMLEKSLRPAASGFGTWQERSSSRSELQQRSGEVELLTGTKLIDLDMATLLSRPVRSAAITNPDACHMRKTTAHAFLIKVRRPLFHLTIDTNTQSLCKRQPWSCASSTCAIHGARIYHRASLKLKRRHSIAITDRSDEHDDRHLKDKARVKSCLQQCIAVVYVPLDTTYIRASGSCQQDKADVGDVYNPSAAESTCAYMYCFIRRQGLSFAVEH
jgi:hypothetical protein